MFSPHKGAPKSSYYIENQLFTGVREVSLQEDSGSAIRVLVINESGFIREGLCKVIERFRGVDVVGSTYFAHDLAEIVQNLRVDVALIDSQFPDQVGFLASRRLHESDVDTRIIILSVNPSLADVKRAFQAGAIGFLLRDAGIRDLEIALHAAVGGELFLCPTLLKRLYEARASNDFLDDIHINANTDQNRYSVDDLLHRALRLGILNQDH